MTTSSADGIDVGGRLINLSQLQTELIAGGVPVEHGLMILGPTTETPGGPQLPLGTELFIVDVEGQRSTLSEAAQPIIDAHVAMRDKTDEEYAVEFQAPGTSVARKQEIRDITAGLLPREQVPMEGGSPP